MILRPPFLLTTVGAWSLVFLAAFEALAVTTVMPDVTADLDGRNLYALAFSATIAAGIVGMVGFGAWADRRGPALPLLVAVAVFAAGLAVAGSAPTMPVFAAGRAVQGLGAGGQTVVLSVLVAAVYPSELHIKIFGAFASAWVLPSLVGPLLAGLAAESVGWRWVFLGVLILVVIATACVLPALKHPNQPRAPQASHSPHSPQMSPSSPQSHPSRSPHPSQWSPSPQPSRPSPSPSSPSPSSPSSPSPSQSPRPSHPAQSPRPLNIPINAQISGKGEAGAAPEGWSARAAVDGKAAQAEAEGRNAKAAVNGKGAQVEAEGRTAQTAVNGQGAQAEAERRGAHGEPEGSGGGVARAEADNWGDDGARPAEGVEGAAADRPGAPGRNVGLAAVVAAAVVTLSALGDGTGAAWVMIPVALAVTAVALRPLVPPRTYSAAPGLPAVIALCIVVGGVFVATDVYLPLLLQERYGWPAWQAGFVLTAGAVAWAVASAIVSRLGDRVNPTATVRAGALLLTSGTAVELATAALHLPAPLVAAGWFVAGAGMGTMVPRVAVLVISYSRPGQAGFNNAAKAIGDAVGGSAALALTGLLFALVPFTGPFALTTLLGVAAVLVAGRVGGGQPVSGERGTPTRQ